MTTWRCISPSTVLFVLLAMPTLLLVFHCLMLKRQSTGYVSKTTDRGIISYSALNCLSYGQSLCAGWPLPLVGPLPERPRGHSYQQDDVEPAHVGNLLAENKEELQTQALLREFLRISYF